MKQNNLGIIITYILFINKFNKNKSEIMKLKDEDNRNVIKGYPIIKEYKYLIIIIDDKIQINHYIY